MGCQINHQENKENALGPAENPGQFCLGIRVFELRCYIVIEIQVIEIRV